MSVSTSPLAPMLRKLNLRRTLADADCRAVLQLPYRLQTIAPLGRVVSQRDVATHSCLLRSGIAYRQQITREGARQIAAIHLSGDMVDLQNSLVRIADHDVVALTTIEVAYIPREAVLDLAFTRRAVGEALWFDTAVDASIPRTWLTNVGQRDARTRIAHLLCELGLRFESAGLGSATEFDLPMSQEFLADCTGLTPVHLNRMLRGLREDGLIAQTRRAVTIVDWAGLARVGEFDPLYLHLPEASQQPR